MSALDPEGVVTFKADGTKYALFFGMRARKAIEAYYDLPFFAALQRAMPSLSPDDVGDSEKVSAAALNLRMTDIAKLFEFGLQRHQPDLSEEQVEDLIDALGLNRTTELLGHALEASMKDEEDGSAAENPPPASRKKKTGSPALQNG